MMDPREIAKMMMLAGWPAAATAQPPTAGTMAGNERSKPLTNVEVMANAMGMAAIGAMASADPGIPIKLCKITISGLGIDQVIGRYVE